MITLRLCTECGYRIQSLELQDRLVMGLLCRNFFDISNDLRPCEILRFCFSFRACHCDCLAAMRCLRLLGAMHPWGFLFCFRGGVRMYGLREEASAPLGGVRSFGEAAVRDSAFLGRLSETVSSRRYERRLSLNSKTHAPNPHPRKNGSYPSRY